MKIVIVDDDKALRTVLRAICEDQGHEVVAEFGDGYVLLDYVLEHQPDVVCLDFNLPGANGLELLSSLNAVANGVNVVMISGSEDKELSGKAADAGATGFIKKPFEQRQIIWELKDIEQTRRIAARAAATVEAPEPPPAPVPAPAAAAVPAAQTAAPIEPLAPVEPVAANAAAAPPPVEPPAPPATSVVPRSAVIVNDSASVRLLLKGILQGLGIKVLGFAANGREGVDVVGKTRPAMVCLDVDMPGMTGIEALPGVRAVSPLTKVVMVTGNAGRDVVGAAIAGGAKGYFLKPIRPAKVEEFIKKLLQL